MESLAVFLLLFCLCHAYGHDSSLTPLARTLPRTLLARAAEPLEEVLQPRSSISTQYLHNSLADDYVITVDHRHHRPRFVSLDGFDGVHGTVQCDSSRQTQGNVELVLTFEQDADLFIASSLWRDGAGLMFLTSLAECDSFGDGAFLEVRTISYDPANLQARIEAAHESLASSTSIGSETLVSGGPRYHPSEQAIVRRELVQTYNGSLNLDQAFAQPRAPLMTTDDFTVTCIDCSMSGQLVPQFSILINEQLANVESSITSDNFSSLVPNATFRVDVPQAINMNMTLEIEAISSVSVSCTVPTPNGFSCSDDVEFPGSAIAALGQDLLSGGDPINLSVGGYQLALSAVLGMTLEANLTGDLTLTVPFDAFIPQNALLEYSLNNGSGDNTLLPAVNVRPPTLTAGAQVCVSVRFGPLVSIGLQSLSSNASLAAASAYVDMPRLDLCAEEVHHVDASCNPGGPFDNAVQLVGNATCGAGTVASALILSTGASVQDNLDSFARCFDIEHTGNMTAYGSDGSASTAGPNGTTQTTDETSSDPPPNPPAKGAAVRAATVSPAVIWVALVFLLL